MKNNKGGFHEVRWRKPGGRVVHSGVYRRGSIRKGGYDGLSVYLDCDHRTAFWFADTEVDRLNLRQPDNARVTCPTCFRRRNTLLPPVTPSAQPDPRPPEEK